MTNFDALLTRSFAEAEQPVDDGFCVRVGAAVARREKAARLRSAIQLAGLAVGVAVAGYGLLGFVFGPGQELLANTGIEATRAISAVDEGAPAAFAQADAAASGLLQSLGLGLTQILLIGGALLGGAVAYRSAAQD